VLSHICDAKGYIAAEYFDKESLINSTCNSVQFRYNPELGFEMYLNDTMLKKKSEL
jgi:hypothetical protein